jgi:hypothetical protein
MNSLPPRKPPKSETCPTADDIERMIQIAKERAALLDDLRVALSSGSTRDIIRLGRMLVGLPAEDANERSQSNRRH